MKRESLLVMMAVALLMPSIASADQAILDKNGFAWETGGFPPSDAGDTLNIVANVNEIDPRFAVDLGAEEVTVYVTGLISTGQVDLGGGQLGMSYTGGTIELYRDPSKDHDFGINPPNATVPSTFVNGSLFLGGVFLDFIMAFDTTSGSGFYEGNIHFNSGSALDTLEQMEADGYTFAGVMDNLAAGGTIPEGYDLQVDGRVEVTVLVGVEETTWSGVKNLFRD